MYGVAARMYSTAHFWLILILATFIPLMIELAFRYAQTLLVPSVTDVLREKSSQKRNYITQKRRELGIELASPMAKTPLSASEDGFSFDNEELCRIREALPDNQVHDHAF